MFQRQEKKQRRKKKKGGGGEEGGEDEEDHLSHGFYKTHIRHVHGSNPKTVLSQAFLLL